VTDLPPRHSERLADLGLAKMLTALAALHVAAGAVTADVLDRHAAVLVAVADALATVVLLAAAALAVRLGPQARSAGPGRDGRSFDVTLAAAALGAAGLATAVRMVATGAAWTGLELPLAILVAAALPRRQAIAAAGASLAASAGAVAGIVTRGPGTAPEVLGSLLPLAAVPVAAALSLAWRRRAALLEARVRAADETARESAVRDQLTGAVNRRGLEMVATRILQNARRQGEAVHCLLVDVDGFRQVNEQAGPQAGDDVLRCVTDALESAVRTTDVVARWSGDEFVVVGPGTGTSPLELERRLHAQLSAVPPLPPEVWPSRVSIGSATLVPWDEGDLASLLRRADQDMRLRSSLRRQRTERDGGTIVAPPQQVEDAADH
jgi:diguanylate cyclase (GGDEF)-like protein